MGSFAGWQGEFQGFFLGLAANNSKAYFEAHRRQYEHDVKAPLLALLADLEPAFGPARVSRPNRDIRFSPDKSPYKTNIYADARSGGYVALSADGLMAAGGRYVLDGAQLQRFRLAVDAARSGAKLAAIVAGLEQRGYLIGGEELKRVPAPPPRGSSPWPAAPPQAVDLLEALGGRTVDRDPRGGRAGRSGMARRAGPQRLARPPPGRLTSAR